MKKTLRFCLVAVLLIALVLGISSVAFAEDEGSISSSSAEGAYGREANIVLTMPGDDSNPWTYTITSDGGGSFDKSTDTGNAGSSKVNVKFTTPVDKSSVKLTVEYKQENGGTKKFTKSMTVKNFVPQISLSETSVTYSENKTISVSVKYPISTGVLSVSDTTAIDVSKESDSKYTLILKPAADNDSTHVITYTTSTPASTCSQNLKIKRADTGITSLKVYQSPKKTSYDVGEYFNPEGMIVEATLADGTKKLYSEGYIYQEHKYTASEAGSDINVTIRLTIDGKKAETTFKTHCNAGSVAALSAVHLNKGKMTLNIGTSDIIVPTSYPENTDEVKYDYVSKDATVAKVNSEGVVTAVSAGSTKIEVKGYTKADKSDAISVFCYITVPEQEEVTSITLSPKAFKLLVGDSTTLTCTVKPSTIENPLITWKSSNKDVCTVNSDGQLTGVKAGTATITATCNGFSSNTIITVVNEISDVVRIVNCRKGVNCRDKASGSAKIIGTAYLDSEYKYLGKSGSWYKIQFTSSKVGYVYKTFVESSDGKKYTPDNKATTNPNATPAPTTASKVTIINCQHRVYIKASASTSARTLGYAELGTTWSLKGKTSDGAWYVVDCKGENGYIQSKFCLVG